VRYRGPGEPVPVRGDEYALEDAVTHVLVNAQRHRVPGSPIEIRLAVDAQSAHIEIRNEGAPIAPERLERIFDYGESDAPAAVNGARRGQGLFVARTYLAKMGGTIAACNDGDGVVFRLSLQRAAA
jgi:two-component system, OmpR family, sensor kinase